MIYLAGPYTHTNPGLRERRFAALTRKAAYLMREGHVVYSPITHGHAIAERHNLPVEFDWWQDQCLGMLGRADKLVVVKLPGWHKSTGVAAEVAFAEERGIPVEYVMP